MGWFLKFQKPDYVRLVGIAGILISLLLFLGVVNHFLVKAASTTEILWALSQACDFEIHNPENSLDGMASGFNETTASCAWEVHSGDSSWAFTKFQSTNLFSTADVNLETAFSVQQWLPEERIELQVSSNDGTDWHTLDVWDENNPPPDTLTEKTYVVSEWFLSPQDLINAQVRFFVPGNAEAPGGFVVNVDAVSLGVVGELQSTDTPTLTASEFFTETSTLAPSESPTITATLPVSGTIEITPTLTLTGTVELPTEVTSVISPTFTVTNTATVTPTSTITLTPTASATPFPLLSLNINGSTEVQSLWGVEQTCSFAVQDAANSLDLNFNDQVAVCTGEYASGQQDWVITGFQHTSFTHVVDVILDVRFKQSGWVDDQFNLELYDGTRWHVLANFGAGLGIPPDVLTTIPYNVFGILSSPEILNTVSMRFSGVKVIGTPDLITLVLDEARLSAAGGFETNFSVGLAAMPAVLSVNLDVAAVGASPHGDQSSTGDSCAACHRSHTSTGNVLRGTWPEESVCFNCHSGGGSGTNVLSAFTAYTNSGTGFYKHDVVITQGIHRIGETTAGNFSGGSRHVECEDCHDPHNSTRGAVSAPNLPLEMTGASGVNPTWTGPGSAASYSWLGNAVTEYQVCFKCHSSFTSLPGYIPDGWTGNALVANGLKKLTSALSQQIPDSRDLAKEFNPYQTSFHPVVAQGRNQNISANTFVSGWSQTSMTYCSDCHNSTAGGGGSSPHGSPLLHMLSGTANFSTVYSNGSSRVSQLEVCFNCHNYQSYVTGQDESSHFKEHDKHLNNNWGTTCYTCHDSHGSEQQHLINLDASAMTFLNGRNSQTAWYYDPANGKAGCYVSCHGFSHNPKEYEP